MKMIESTYCENCQSNTPLGVQFDAFGGRTVTICQSCVAKAFVSFQQGVQRTVAKCAPDQHDFSKSIECAKCGELLF